MPGSSPGKCSIWQPHPSIPHEQQAAKMSNVWPEENLWWILQMIVKKREHATQEKLRRISMWSGSVLTAIRDAASKHPWKTSGWCEFVSFSRPVIGQFLPILDSHWCLQEPSMPLGYHWCRGKANQKKRLQGFAQSINLNVFGYHLFYQWNSQWCHYVSGSNPLDIWK